MSFSPEEREYRTSKLPREQKIPLNNAERKEILLKELENLSRIINFLESKNSDGYGSNFTRSYADKSLDNFNFKKRRKIHDMIETSKIFRDEIHQFLETTNYFKKNHLPDSELIFLAIICRRTYQAIRFLSNEPTRPNYLFDVKQYEPFVCDILWWDGYRFDETKALYDINFHEGNLSVIQVHCSFLSGYRWESVRNAAYALSAALFCVSIAIGLTVGTGGIAFPAIVAFGALSTGFGFYASKDSGIAKAVSHLELNAIEFPSLK